VAGPTARAIRKEPEAGHARSAAKRVPVAKAAVSAMSAPARADPHRADQVRARPDPGVREAAHARTAGVKPGVSAKNVRAPADPQRADQVHAPPEHEARAAAHARIGGVRAGVTRTNAHAVLALDTGRQQRAAQRARIAAKDVASARSARVPASLRSARASVRQGRCAMAGPRIVAPEVSARPRAVHGPAGQAVRSVTDPAQQVSGRSSAPNATPVAGRTATANVAARQKKAWATVPCD